MVIEQALEHPVETLVEIVLIAVLEVELETAEEVSATLVTPVAVAQLGTMTRSIRSNRTNLQKTSDERWIFCKEDQQQLRAPFSSNTRDRQIFLLCG